MGRYSIITQYKGCLYQYGMRVRFKSGPSTSVKTAMKSGIGRVKPVLCYSSSAEGKIRQFGRLLDSIKIDCHLNNGYIYFLDEKTVAYNAFSTIDNMPVDYSIVVDYSLNDLRRINEGINNDISKQNIAAIGLIEKFISKIEHFQNNNNSKQIAYISNMRSKKAETLEEALQRILFWNMLLCQTDHILNGLGRLDKILDRFCYDKDLDSCIERFLRCLHLYYEFKSNAILGDTGQVIILGGIEEDGSYFCNPITYSFLKGITNINYPDPKALLRVSKKMPDDLLYLAIDCIAIGCGSPLLSDDDEVIPAIENFGYKHDDAVNYAVSACWEPLIPGRSLEQNNLFDIDFGKAFADSYSDKNFKNAQSINDVLKIYRGHLELQLDDLCRRMNAVKWEKDPVCTLLSRDCLDNNKDISDGGSQYNNYGLLSVGLAAAVDSLLNIERFVFNEKKYSIDEVVDSLASDYKNNQQMWELFSKNERGFGSNSQESIEMTDKIMGYVEACLVDYRNPFGGKVKFGLSSPAYINNGKMIQATADGRKSGEPFRTHISKDSSYSMLDVMKFSSLLDFNGIRSNGNVADIMIQPNLISSDKDKFIKYLRGCLKMGFYQAQFNVLTYAQLVDAKAHPEKYPNLIVRVWGFSAYFNDLPEEYKDTLIERAKKCMEN